MAIEDVRFDALGQLVVNLVTANTSRALLYVEFEDGVFGLSLFHEDDGKLYYVSGLGDLTDELIRLANAFGSEVRAMEFELVGERFSTRLIYRDKFDADADQATREDAVQMRYFGRTTTETLGPDPFA
jgi:hypothetical protein